MIFQLYINLYQMSTIISKQIKMQDESPAFFYNSTPLNSFKESQRKDRHAVFRYRIRPERVHQVQIEM